VRSEQQLHDPRVLSCLPLPPPELCASVGLTPIIPDPTRGDRRTRSRQYWHRQPARLSRLDDPPDHGEVREPRAVRGLRLWRNGTPTQKALEDAVAAIEGAHRLDRRAVGLAVTGAIVGFPDTGDHDC
jgi:cystathionine beta-lyase/cystathionine gamma-synthase